MILELQIKNMGEYVDFTTKINDEQAYRMWYRGQSDFTWGLVPSVQRCKEKRDHYEQYIQIIL